MSIESAADLAGMQQVGGVVALTLAEMKASARIGMTTAELDAVAASTFRRLGARSAPQLAYNFPGVTCISVNDEIVHGIPGPRRLEPGDVLKIDVTAELGGYIADAATTILLPPISPIAIRLKRAASQALEAALSAARTGKRVSVIGRAVESEARRSRFAVVRELCGHAVGRTIHESPSVPNYEDRFSRDMLTEGLVIAVEPLRLAYAIDPLKKHSSFPVSYRKECDALTVRNPDWICAAGRIKDDRRQRAPRKIPDPDAVRRLSNINRRAFANRRQA
jgi:methionyl aminopeptidase